MKPNSGAVATATIRGRFSAACVVSVLLGGLQFALPWAARAGTQEAVGKPNNAHSATAAVKPKPQEPAAKKAEFNRGDWPFQPLARPDVPQLTKLKAWARNPVDQFIGEKLEANKLEPSKPADKLTLLRRVTYDLTGLPPTMAEQTAFLADHSPEAYAKVVDRLLNSPQYGERWAQHWLDLVRYSETDGFKKDSLRQDAYKYRDYVIRAFNNDLPYDRFIRQQLAGDELEPENHDAIIATGFIRLYPEDINASNLVLQRQEILDDITENTGLAFLGLTVGCARCHDHKFDPIKQTDYYRLQACFAAVLPNDDATVASKQQIADYQKRIAAWERATKDIRQVIDTRLADERQLMMQEAIEAYDPQTLAAIKTPPEKRDCFQKQLAAEAEEWIESRIERAIRRCQPEEKKLLEAKMEELAKFDSMKPEPLPTAMAVTDGGSDAPRTCLLEGGNYLKPEQEVAAGFPEFLGESNPELGAATHKNTTGRRSALAKWLTEPDHPMTARVMINRVWQFHFGQGIVATPNDFGAMGGSPSHQELLDWLASEYVHNGWHLKPLHRLMVLSATYCQSSAVDTSAKAHAAALAVDAANNLLWHARRQRLEGEALRDTFLRVSGKLNLKMFGPSAHPELPKVLEDTRYGWYADKSEEDRNRRSIYVLAKRNMRLPLLEAFDQPDQLNSCARRTTTTTSPQALELLNGELTEEMARSWSGRLLAASGNDETKLVREAYEEAYGRAANAKEVQAAEQFIDEQAEVIAKAGEKIDSDELPSPMPKRLNLAKAAAIVDLCHAILCSNELLFVD